MKKVQFFSVAIILAIIAICGCSNDSEEENNEENISPVELSEYNASKILGSGYRDKESIEIPANITSISSNVFSYKTYNKLGQQIVKSSNIKKITFEKGSRLCDIKKDAFRNCILESIELPEGLEKIHDRAFIDSSLKKLKIPKNVTYIGEEAFQFCSLEELEIQENVTYIGRRAFQYCTKLKKLTLPASIKDATVEIDSFGIFHWNIRNIIDEIRYKGTIEDWCKITWFQSATSWLVNKFYFEDSDTPATSIEIPSTVTSIPPEAFEGNYSLISVTLPDNDIIIGEDAFCSCKNLSNIRFGSGKTQIGEYAFGDCDNLSNIEFGSGSTQIGEEAFRGCDKLESIKLPNGTIGENAFGNCENLKSIEIDNGIIEDRVFYNGYNNLSYNDFSNLESVVIASGTIGGGTFSECKNLKYVKLGNGVTSIGDGAFSGCSSLLEVTIPNSVTSIGDSTFSGCSRLSEVVIPNSVTSIGNSAFSSCSSLLEIVIPNSVTSIGSNAFIKCTSLKRAIFEVKNQYWQQVSNDGSIDEVGRNFNNEEETAKWLQHGNKKLERL